MREYKEVPSARKVLDNITCDGCKNQILGKWILLEMVGMEVDRRGNPDVPSLLPDSHSTFLDFCPTCSETLLATMKQIGV